MDFSHGCTNYIAFSSLRSLMLFVVAVCDSLCQACSVHNLQPEIVVLGGNRICILVSEFE